MNNYYLNKLEYNKILEILSNYSSTYIGKDMCLNLLPSNDKQEVKEKLEETKEAVDILYRSSTPPITDIEDVLMHMLEQIKQAGKRLLITIDEVVNEEEIRIFASSFQIFIREDYPIYLLMTGPYENIYELQNNKALTFLYRAPKLILEPLNYTAIRKSYMDIFSIEAAQAEKMTALTKGYPFAFQVLGYLYWENRKLHSIEEILPEYDQYLDEYVYSKIWSELSELDKKILMEMAVSGEDRVKNIRENLQMDSGKFAVYRERLKRKGVVDTREYGKMHMALPRFEEYVKTQII